MGIKISKDHLHPSVIESITSLIGDLNQLETTAKGNAVEAINELLANGGNKEELEALIAEIAEGKELIANAVGEPLTAEESFDEMSNDINGLLSTFKTNMMNNGITVESSDKFKTLIDKIATMVEEGSNKGVRFIQGSIQTIDLDGEGYYVVVENIPFKPDIIVIHDGDYHVLYDRFTSDNNYHIFSYMSGDCYNGFFNNSTDFVTDSSFSLATFSNSGGVATYYAIGVGEEDTTLRDSLASILQEEGVSISDEDDMASLISKVDEEFDVNRNRLYELMSEGGYDVNSGMSMDDMLGMLELSGISVGDIKQIACGQYHAFILKNDGSLWATGYNSDGHLGLGDTTDRNTFTQVTTNINNDVKQIVCGGAHTFILKNDGSVWSCGLNNKGQLGLNNTTNESTFTQVTTNINNDVKQIACGWGYTFILKNDGSLWACGWNNYGQLGLGDTTDRTTFTQVTTNINNDVKQVVSCWCGEDDVYEYTFIVKNDGSLWACGYNEYGNLGLDDETNRTTFTQVTNNINNDVKQIACGYDYKVILKNDGSVWSCGYNNYGQLGLGDTGHKTSFTQVTKNINNDVKQIACGIEHTIILKNDGSVWACGNNTSGQLGLGNTTTYKTFTQVTTNINNDVKQIACGDNHTFILKNDGSVWSCGWNGYGQLGLGVTITYNKFTQVPRGF